MAVVLCHGPPGCHASVAWINDEHGPRHRRHRRPRPGAGHAPGRRGGHRLAHARSEERGRETLAELLDGPGDVRLVVGDLASLERCARWPTRCPTASTCWSTTPASASPAAAQESDGRLRAALRGQLPRGLPARRAAARSPGRRRRRRGSSTSPPPASRRSTSTTSCSRTATTARARTARASSRRSCTRSTWPRSCAARGVTATALHPATYMPTKMVTDAGVTPVSTVEEGLEATWRLVADPALDGGQRRLLQRHERGARRRAGLRPRRAPAAARAARRLEPRCDTRHRWPAASRRARSWGTSPAITVPPPTQLKAGQRGAEVHLPRQAAEDLRPDRSRRFPRGPGTFCPNE